MTATRAYKCHSFGIGKPCTLYAQQILTLCETFPERKHNFIHPAAYFRIGPGNLPAKNIKQDNVGSGVFRSFKRNGSLRIERVGVGRTQPERRWNVRSIPRLSRDGLPFIGKNKNAFTVRCSGCQQFFNVIIQSDGLINYRSSFFIIKQSATHFVICDFCWLAKRAKDKQKHRKGDEISSVFHNDNIL